MPSLTVGAIQSADMQGALPTFELLHVEPDCGDNVEPLLLLRHEVVQDGRLPGVVQPHHQHVALLQQLTHWKFEQWKSQVWRNNLSRIP